jgi:hypothetical protein
VYCGNPLKDSDKYCIICGKPVLTDVKKPKKNQSVKFDDEIQVPIEELELESEQEATEFEKIKEKKKKGKKIEKEVTEKPLPFEVKEQMILYIDYNDIKLNKELLLEKLKDVQTSIKDPRYDVDMDYKKTVTVKLEAIKTLIAELKQKETEIDQKMNKPFIVQRIQEDIEKKVFQLKNLSQQHKLHKVDRESFEKLREKYKTEKEELETERKDLVTGMKLWIKELKMEKAEVQSERNLNKGRFSAKEIKDDDFKEKDKEFEIKLKKIDVKIKTLENLIK